MWWQTFTITFLLAAFGAGGCSENRVGSEPGPSFTLPRLHDTSIVLRSTDLTLPAVLNFWASWCLPCRREHPHLMALAQADVAVVYGLNYRDDPADARRWLDYYGDPFEVTAFDLTGAQLEVFAADGIPQTIVLDREGKIRFHHVGPLTKGILNQQLIPLLRESNSSSQSED